MAHNINIKANGQASFVSKKELPWHGLGTIVQDSLTSEQAMILGGLDFEVEKRSLYVPGKDFSIEEAKQHKRIQRRLVTEDDKAVAKYNNLVKFKSQFATVRTDNDYPLGIVGNKYTIVQNREAFEFFDSIVQDGIAEYETAGALGNGEVVFISAKVTESMTIHTDKIDKYLLISLSHDGSSSISVAYTPIRVVCNNTLTLALQNNVNKVQIRHTASAQDRLQAAKETLGLIDYGDKSHTEYFNRLLDIHVTEGQVIELFSKAYSIKLDDDLSTRGKNILETSLDYYYKGLGQKEYVGTGWGAYNAVTGYLQNVKNYTDEDNRFKSTLMSTQQTIRNKVVDSLFELEY
jgi:phage/plasmid-like protein (TIGR03299 family)